jgi:hypothetical protein
MATRYTVIVHDNGTEQWTLNDLTHRENGPAIERPNGDKEWYFAGRYHRESGPAVIHADGYQAWYHHGVYHREDGPAFIYGNNSESWYLNGKRHRLDGPAVTKYSKHRGVHKEWWINGKKLTEEEFLERQGEIMSNSDTEYIPTREEVLKLACFATLGYIIRREYDECRHCFGTWNRDEPENHSDSCIVAISKKIIGRQ